MYKRIVFCFIILLIYVFLGKNVYANVEEIYDSSGWYGYFENDGIKIRYEILPDETAILTKIYNQNITNLTIPAYVGSRKVTIIGKNFLNHNETIKEITIPNTVNEIEMGAFACNEALEKVNLPKSVEEIGSSAFHNDMALKNINLDNVKIIGDYAFEGCSSLEKIQANNAYIIYPYAFIDCTSLKEVKLLREEGGWIGGGAFVNTPSLEKVYLSEYFSFYDDGNCFFKDEKVTIYGLKDTEAEKYAKEYNINFVPVIFVDVFEDNWFYNAVMYNYNNNYIKGTDETHFAPYDKLTRGMIVTILWRMEGSPDNDGKSKFTDVASNAWYAKAVKWAAVNKIVSGYSGTTNFGPKDNILRQDLAGILRNYARYKEKNIDITSDLTKFKDYNKISNYAKASMEWAVGTGVISGNGDGTLVPKGNATRAEAAAMIQKYCNKVGK